jgi:pimeloyl-ACP methyl ester carboxylesterase
MATAVDVKSTRYDENRRATGDGQRLVDECAATGSVLMTVKSEDRHIGGVRVEIHGEPTDSPPLLFVHGGCQASWSWERVAPRLADDGWYAVCLNWYGRIPSLAYATANPVPALVLLAPVLPAGFGADPIELAVDPTSMWMPPPALIRPTWWAGVPDDESRRYTSLLVPESPRAVLEATRWLCEVNTSDVHTPTLVIAAGADALIPAQVRLLAKALSATFVLFEGEGHGIIVNPVWHDVAIRISDWLSQLEGLAG